MIAGPELQEYLDEIRQEVCSRCVERPYGGPPCGPLGKPCGVELHLPQLVESVRAVHSDLIAPYLDTNRREVCEHCPYLHNADCCPCPMDSLAVLVVEAIEAVDRRRQRRGHGPEVIATLPGHDRPDMAEVSRAYEAAAGTWASCDWPTAFGPAALDLQGWTAAEAEAHAVEAPAAQRKDWEAAARWLTEVERRAEEAEAEAEMAVRAAAAGDWPQAAEHAWMAWSIEFSTGRPFRQGATAWQRLYKAVTAGASAHDEREARDLIQVSIRLP
jgi:hypothetical protein